MEKYGVVHEAWAPFGEGRGGFFENPVLEKIGVAYGKSTAQVMLRWLLQRNIVILPKSVKAERMAENIAVFDFRLSEDAGTVRKIQSACPKATVLKAFSIRGQAAQHSRDAAKRDTLKRLGKIKVK